MLFVPQTIPQSRPSVELKATRWFMSQGARPSLEEMIFVKIFGSEAKMLSVDSSVGHPLTAFFAEAGSFYAPAYGPVAGMTISVVGPLPSAVTVVSTDRTGYTRRWNLSREGDTSAYTNLGHRKLEKWPGKPPVLEIAKTSRSRWAGRFVDSGGHGVRFYRHFRSEVLGVRMARP